MALIRETDWGQALLSERSRAWSGWGWEWAKTSAPLSLPPRPHVQTRPPSPSLGCPGSPSGPRAWPGDSWTGFWGLHRLLSSYGEWGLLQLYVVSGLLTAVASLVANTGSRAPRFQQLWLLGSRAQAKELWCKGLAAPQHVGSSQIRDRTHVSCISRRILYNRVTREAPYFLCNISFPPFC